NILPQIVNYGPFVQWLGLLDGSGRPSSRPRWSSGNIAAFAPLAMHLQVLVLDSTKPEFRLVTSARHLIIR
ncbi:MAG: hypothetical protein KDC95_17485, partial [Planctomycetes bacterium]|nr:hypothetical protein [Planctomycetota bacterium]